MTAVQITEKVNTLIVDQLGVDVDAITPEASFKTDLGCDSLDTIELMMAVEEEFNLQIPDEDAETFATVRDVYAYLVLHAK